MSAATAVTRARIDPASDEARLRRRDTGRNSRGPETRMAAHLTGVDMPPVFARGILALQASHGNQHVLRLLAAKGMPGAASVHRKPSIQKEGASPTPTPAPSGAGQLTLDPEIEARIRAIQAVRQTLDPKALKPNLTLLPLGTLMLPPPNLLAGPSIPKPSPLVPVPDEPREGEEPQKPREADAGDVAEAVMKVPAIDRAVTGLKTQALGQVKRDWRALSLGDKVVTVSSLAMIGGGALAGVVSDPQARSFVFSQLDGKVIPVPGVEGLGVEFNTKGKNLMVGIHLDVGRILPKELGFGPGSASAIGAPPGMEK